MPVLTDSSLPNRPLKGFFRYEEELENDIFAFQREEYPDRDAESIPAKWRWTFLESARRLAVTPFVWLYCKEDRVVAHQGAIPVLLKIRDQQVVTGWFVETMAATSVRGKAVGPMLVKKALEDLPLNLSMGQTAEMRALQHALGWVTVCALPEFLFVADRDFSLRHKLPPLVAELSAAAIAKWHEFRLSKQQRSLEGRYSVKRVMRFDAEHDALWEQMSETCVCAVVRDASYLNWKYVDRPGGDFACLELREDSKLVGVAIVMVRKPGKTYAYSRGFIVDIVAPLDQMAVLRTLVAESIAECKKRGAKSVICSASDRNIQSALQSLGFLQRESHYRFLIALEPGQTDRNKILQDPSNWYLSIGDSDADEFAI